MNVFNLSLNHGEEFLPDVLSYDTLYYEIIRASDDFMTLARHGKFTINIFILLDADELAVN